MSTIHFHRRFKAEKPVPHYCEEWNVHSFSPHGDLESFRVTFKLNRRENPCFQVALEAPSGRFVSLDTKNNFKRIGRVMLALEDEYKDYKQNRNYKVKIE